MLDHRVLSDLAPRPGSARLRVSWPAPAPARRLNLRRGGQRLATAAGLGLAGAALLAAPRLRFAHVPRWWPSFMRAARAAGPKAVVWTVIWAVCNATVWIFAGFKEKDMA